MANFYYKVSINNSESRVPKTLLRERIQFLIGPYKESYLPEIRFWHRNEL